MTILRGVLLSIAAAVPAFCQSGAPLTVPIPDDPLEIVRGPIDFAPPAERNAILKLLERARSNYAVRKDGPGYHLKVSFTVDSGGATQHDGAWEMEETYAPGKGLRWTAKTEAGYSATQISHDKLSYRESSGSTYPLRLHEARAALFGPIATSQYVDKDRIRIATATWKDVEMTCVLLSGASSTATPTPGRQWEESEDCIDPQSGRLVLHSLAPGRYELYDYTGAPTIGGHTLPHSVTITEGGKTTTELRVDSFTELPDADAAMFVPTMAESEPGITLGQAHKISVLHKPGRIASNSTIHPVCVFGLINSAGQVVEAHSLQPADPNSLAAVEAAMRMNFHGVVATGARPEQRFVFIVEKFVSTP
jgi:hypothetical protein